MTWAPDYATVQELKDYLRITDTVDDVFLALWVTAASRNVDDFCGRQFGKVATPEARTYSGIWDRHICRYVLQIDDLMTAPASVVDSSGSAVTDYTFRPTNVLLKNRPYERLYASTSSDLTITAAWGWSAIPSSVKAGLFLQGARLAARRDSPFGIAGSPSDGSEIRLLAQLDPDFRTSLKPFRRDWWAA